jgi:hypothetical protein
VTFPITVAAVAASTGVGAGAPLELAGAAVCVWLVLWV